MIPVDTTTGEQCGNPVHTKKKVGPCYGLCCPKRGQCLAFVARWPIDGDPIETCQVGSTWPLFVKREM